MNVVDLPGYGFAFANEENQKQWQDTVSVCFKSHPRLVFVPVSLCWCAPVCMHVCVCVCVASFFFLSPHPYNTVAKHHCSYAALLRRSFVVFANADADVLVPATVVEAHILAS